VIQPATSGGKSPEPEDDRVYTFESTHHAMWAEDVAREASIPAEIVPAPLKSGAKCALALRTTRAHFDGLGNALDEEGVEYRTFP
jgi:hypothetical protein